MKYSVKQPLTHDQKDYPVGSEVELTEEQAAALQLVEVVGDAISGSEASSGKQLNVDQTVEVVKAAQSEEELIKLMEGETRKGVLNAIAARAQELGLK